jgi:cobalt-zinc-cadmium efflux system membrane fusion protein
MAATVQSFSNRASPRYQAMPVAAPPNAVAGTMTVDVFHALDNGAARFAPGQRLSVELQMQAQGRYDTIPWRAVVFDIHGNAWVYEKTADRAYNRKRVVIDHVSRDVAAIAHGPAPGKEIVDNGAQEIFALETGYTK